uniref:F-box family protein n=1 Tax=Pithovirus LCPAC406 TaxID=2506599 RepID=A0A481ZFV0_9VIRU|nr:MAG: F-box family protein [Pithovirus LCPAC406]
MDKIYMINMNGVWVDGRTYREILNDVLQNGVDVVTDLQAQYLLPYANDSKEEVNYLQQQYSINDDDDLQDFAELALGRYYTDDELNDIYYIRNREMDVIYATIRTYKGAGLYLPGDTITDTSKTSLPSYEFIRDMIDPIFYVMQFSSFDQDKLIKIKY